MATSGILGFDEGCDESLEVYGDVPQARFGHTITLVSNSKVVLFGGATGDTGKYIMTGDTYLFNILTKGWTKLASKQGLMYSCKRSTSKSESGSQFNKC